MRDLRGLQRSGCVLAVMRFRLLSCPWLASRASSSPYVRLRGRISLARCGLWLRSEEPFHATRQAFDLRLVDGPPSREVFSPYDVSEMRAATPPGLCLPGSATSSDFLNLLTFSSAHIRTALSRAESVLGVEAPRGFPLPSPVCSSWKVRSRRYAVTRYRRPILSQPFPLEVSPFEPWPLSRKASSHGLRHDAGWSRRRDRSPEFQRARGLAGLFRAPPPSAGFCSGSQ